MAGCAVSEQAERVQWPVVSVDKPSYPLYSIDNYLSVSSFGPYLAWHSFCAPLCVCVCACVRACVRACVCVCVCVRVCRGDKMNLKCGQCVIEVTLTGSRCGRNCRLSQRTV